MVKYVIVQAVDFNGAIKYNQRIKGKKNQLPTLREAMDVLTEGGYLRTQTEGAKGWAVYTHAKGAKSVEQIFSREIYYEPAMAMFKELHT